jgi:non-ribosomal peptide synthetase component F
VPIGRGIHNSRLYVLDSCMRPVPIGVPGQLFISGVCLSGGYLNRPELNATTFVPNPFHAIEAPGSNTELMYRTGEQPM